MSPTKRARDLLGPLAAIWGVALLALALQDSAAYGRFLLSLWFR